MTTCSRFEEEGLLRLEQGLPLDAHFESCSDCRAAVAEYQRLREQIQASASGFEPPVGWEGRVRNAVKDRRARSRGWLVTPLGIAATATAVVVGGVLWRAGQRPATAAFEVKVESGGPVRRGSEAKPGDVLHLRATTGGARHAELRVYLRDNLVLLRCSSEPPCARDGDILSASLRLESIGPHQPVLVFFERPLPEPSSGLDADMGSLRKAGGDYLLGREISVR